MTGTTPPALDIAKARAQEFPSTLTSAELRRPDESVGVGLCGIPYCLTQFSHHTIWHSASEVELPLPTRLGLGLELRLGLGGGLCPNHSH